MRVLPRLARRLAFLRTFVDKHRSRDNLMDRSRQAPQVWLQHGSMGGTGSSPSGAESVRDELREARDRRDTRCDQRGILGGYSDVIPRTHPRILSHIPDLAWMAAAMPARRKLLNGTPGQLLQSQ